MKQQADQPQSRNASSVALLTGGGDKPYVFGLGTQLISRGVQLEIIGSDDLDCPEFHRDPHAKFLNLRGDQNTNVSFLRKAIRLSAYYFELICWAATAEPRIFHILWNNKIEWFDRTILMLYYKALRKKIVLTVHNVNRGKRDSKDSLSNRFTLRTQYRLSDHLFVHTEKMRGELVDEFGVRPSRISVIPFGINNSVPNTGLTRSQARRRLGIREEEKTILFFGNITPYKGLEYLTSAFQKSFLQRGDFRLVVAGWPKNCAEYWEAIRQSIHSDVQSGRILLRDEYIPDEETEVYFKAADVLALPYRHIYQSGVLFLGYSFGLPVLASNVGSLKDDIIEGETGFVFKPDDVSALAEAIEQYFSSEMFGHLSERRLRIRKFATERNSWGIVGQKTIAVYAMYAGMEETFPLGNIDSREPQRAPVDMNVP